MVLAPPDWIEWRPPTSSALNPSLDSPISSTIAHSLGRIWTLLMSKISPFSSAIVHIFVSPDAPAPYHSMDPLHHLSSSCFGWDLSVGLNM